MSYFVEDHENGPLRANGAGGPPRTDKQPLLAHALTSEGHDSSEDGTGRGTPLVSFDAEFSNQGEPHELATLTRKLKRAVSSEATGVRRLTPRECERLQALPDDWTAHGPDSRRYAALGDAVTSSVAEWIGRRLMKVAA